ncbi:MAG: Lrp/AsnC family transcriptional regulator [Deltaproteobacteria bacterium]|nr:Lrp/AsnC family transcriptional regulator [Deltaproteobacteria bacterium]
MPQFSSLEAKILNLIQREFPLTERPFDAIGAMIEISGADVIRSISDLKERSVVRNISAIFSGETLGYHLSLVALKVPPERVEAAAAFINAHPGVSHNYLRDHAFNLWFTLAEEDEEALQKSARVIQQQCCADDFLMLRNEKLLKIGFVLPIGDEAEGALESVQKPLVSRDILDREDRDAVFLLQSDLPLVERPFDVLGETDQSWNGDRLIEAGRRLLASGFMRRYAAVLRHAHAGFTHNAMTAWKIAIDDGFDARIRPFMDEGAVTHLYLRTLYPGKWEYPLFAMLHARSSEELESLLDSLARRSGLNERLVLRSLYEYKKKKVRYFSPAFKKWKHLHYD